MQNLNNKVSSAFIMTGGARYLDRKHVRLPCKRPRIQSPRPSGTFFCGDLVIQIFLWPFPLFYWFKKSSCQLLAKECALSMVQSGNIAHLRVLMVACGIFKNITQY